MFFEKMSFSIRAEADFKDQTLTVGVRSDEPRVLIGERGRVLACIQKLLKAILQKKFSKKEFYFNIDINDYKRKKAQYLRELAEETADEVALSREEQSLPPMSSYERRIIHLQLAGRPDVMTESVGLEPERRVTIKPFLK